MLCSIWFFFECVYLESRCIWMFCGEFLWPVGPLQEMRCDMMWKKPFKIEEARHHQRNRLKSNIEDESYNQIKGDKWVAGGALAMLLLWMICLCTCAFEAQNLRHLETSQPQCTRSRRSPQAPLETRASILQTKTPRSWWRTPLGRFTVFDGVPNNGTVETRWVFHMTTVSSVICLGLKQFWPLPNNWGCHNICA